MTQTPPKVAEALESIADRWFTEQRRARRWTGFWRGLIAFYFGLFVAFYLASNWDTLWTARGPHAAVVKIEGPIGSRDQASAESVIKALRAAFDNPRAKAVLLAIDSPGGSPVQAELISAEIKRLRGRHSDRPILAVIGDTGASAAYSIAASTDTIYASRASLVGSIGVRIDSFGFEGALRELGVERRLLTAGAHKSILDPFSPLPEGQRALVQEVLDALHGQFVGVVKQGRGGRLNGREELFRGLFWSGEQAQALELVDAIGDTPYRRLHAQRLRAGLRADVRGRPQWRGQRARLDLALR
jgi:protease IV